MQSKNEGRFYHPELDGLRFIAFLLVFIHNAPRYENSAIWKVIHEYGWIGVDLFFCLSGFLITKLLLAENYQRGRINIRDFYIRRILRIWPLYFFYIPLAIFYIYQDQGWYGIVLSHSIGLVTFTYNFVYLFLTFKMFFVFVHLWTISYEGQFYAIIPWVVRKSIKIRDGAKLMSLVLIFLAGNFIRALLIHYQVKHPVIYMLPFTHFEAMLGGMALATGLLDKHLKVIQNRQLFLLGILCNAIIFWLPNTYDIGWSLMLTYPLVGIGMTLILFSVINSRENQFKTMFLKNKYSVYLGKISYGLYTFHIISISLAIQIFKNVFHEGSQQSVHYFISIFIAGLIPTILLSALSYRWIEKPFLKLKAGFGQIITRPI